MKFSGIPESSDESFTTCSNRILDILQSYNIQKSWSLTDIIRVQLLHDAVTTDHVTTVEWAPDTWEGWRR